MNDREYIKLNTSIQTGSNRDELLRDKDGNIQATVELRLPDNLFGDNAHTRKIDHVSMQTSKMRMSMENLPIASLPLITPQPEIAKDVYMSTCQLDVYPFSITSDGKITPKSYELSNTAFPYYKKHYVWLTVNAKIYDSRFPNPSSAHSQLVRSYMISNPLYTDVPALGINADPNDEVMNALKIAGLEQTLKHPLNLVVRKNHPEVELSDDGKKVYVTDATLLEKMWSDALENALTYACTYNVQTTPEDENYPYVAPWYQVEFVGGDSIPDDIQMELNYNSKIFVDCGYIEQFGETVGFDGFFHKISYISASRWAENSSLDYVFKPSVRMGDNGFSIAYDSAIFNQTVPIICNPVYVNTGERSAGLSLTKDIVARELWDGQKPVKRLYKYNVTNNIDGETGESTSYNFALNTFMNSAPMNIIANRAMVENFSFLPWIRIDIEDYPFFKPRPGEYRYSVSYTETPRDEAATSIDSYFNKGAVTVFSCINQPNNSHAGIPQFSCMNEDGETKEFEYVMVIQFGLAQDDVDLIIDGEQDPDTPSDLLEYMLNTDNWIDWQFKWNRFGGQSRTSLPGSEVLVYKTSPYASTPEGVPSSQTVRFNTNDPSQTHTPAFTEDKTIVNPPVIDHSTYLNEPAVRYVTQEEADPTWTEPGFTEQWRVGRKGIKPMYNMLPIAEWDENPGNDAAQLYIPKPKDPVAYRAQTTPYNDYICFSCIRNGDEIVENETFTAQCSTMAGVECYKCYYIIQMYTHGSTINPAWLHPMMWVPTDQPVWKAVDNTTTYRLATSDSTVTTSFLPCDYYMPNLDLDDGRYFYILDGSSSDLKIGNQEIVKANDGLSQPYHVKVSKHVTSTDINITFEESKLRYTKGIFEGVMLGLDRTAWLYDVLFSNILEREWFIFTKVGRAVAFVIEWAIYSARFERYKIDGDWYVDMNTIRLYRQPNRYGTSYISDSFIRDDVRTLSSTHTPTSSSTPVVIPTEDEEYNSSDQSLEVGVTISDPVVVSSIVPNSGSGTTVERDYVSSDPAEESHFWLLDWDEGFDGLAMDLTGGGIILDVNFIVRHFVPDSVKAKAWDKIFQKHTRWMRVEAKRVERYAESGNPDPDQYIPNMQPRVTSNIEVIQTLSPTSAQETERELVSGFLYYPVGAVNPYSDGSYDPPYTLKYFFEEDSAGHYVKNEVTTVTTTTITENVDTERQEELTLYKGNLRLTFSWDNLPTVVLSPIQSIVLTLEGVQVNQEYQPVNATQPGGSSLTSTVPIIENYFSLAQTLRDLHDELVVVKETFDDTATYTLATTSGKERVLRFSAKYITKDGFMRQIYIPPNGVFALQITFGVSYYTV